ncbi:MAG: selenocysteine synthase [Acidobacteriota bacterium]
MSHRRGFLKTLSTLPVVGGLMPNALSAATTKRDFFKELGVKPFINAAGTYTTLSASLMNPDAVAAYDYASKQFVKLTDLHDAVGKKIAALLNVEAAMVTSGAAGALTSGTAACVAGNNPDYIRVLPDLDGTGMKSEVIIQKLHRYGYDHAVRNCGIKMIEVESAADMGKAINSKTAMALFFNANNNIGQIKDAEFVAICKKHKIPSFNDAAADALPVENLWKWTKMGFDLVTFSGGKGIRGPQSAGLLLGRADLIAAARANSSPNGDAIGRGMKVNKEELLSMMVAIESYVKMDHDAEFKEWEKRCKLVQDSVSSIPSIQMSVDVPEIANRTPHLHIKWDQSKVKISYRQVIDQLRTGDPAIETTPGGRDELVVNFWMLQPGEAQIVAKRIREILKAATV